VELARLQCRNDAIPVLRDEGALGLHLRAEGLGDVDVEAFQLAVRSQVVEGRVGAFGADADLHRILGVRRAHGERNCRRREGECHSSGDSHDVLTLVLATAMGPLVTSRAVSETRALGPIIHSCTVQGNLKTAAASQPRLGESPQSCSAKSAIAAISLMSNTGSISPGRGKSAAIAMIDGSPGASGVVSRASRRRASIFGCGSRL